MIRHHGDLIDGKPALSSHALPVAAQFCTDLRAEDPRAAVSHQNHVMIQVKAGMGSRQRRWPVSSVAKDGRQDSRSVAVVLGLKLKIGPNRFNSHFSNRPSEITAR